MSRIESSSSIASPIFLGSICTKIITTLSLNEGLDLIPSFLSPKPLLDQNDLYVKVSRNLVVEIYFLDLKEFFNCIPF